LNRRERFGKEDPQSAPTAGEILSESTSCHEESRAGASTKESGKQTEWRKAKEITIKEIEQKQDNDENIRCVFDSGGAKTVIFKTGRSAMNPRVVWCS